MHSVHTNKQETTRLKFIELSIGDLFIYNGFIWCKSAGGFALNMQTNKQHKLNFDLIVEVA